MGKEKKRLLEELANWIFNNIIGCLAGLMWCYIVVVQFDPNLECPREGCWRVVWALWAWSFVGVIALPWLSLVAMRTLRKEPAKGRWASLEDETLANARELMARAMGTAWSVGLYSAVSASAKQFEYDALSGGFLARCDTQGIGCALKGVLALTALAALVAAAATASAVFAMGCASRVLARGNQPPLVVEMMLMIRSNLYYTVAYSWTTTLGLLWFAPYELGPVADNALTPRSTWNESVRGAFAGMRAATLVALFTHLALTDGCVRDPPADDDVESTAAAPWTTCARLLAFKACAVTVAIAGNDAAQGVLANFQSSRRLNAGFDFTLTVSGFAYAAVLLVAGALCFCFASPYRRARRLETQPLFFQQEPKGPRFARLVYTWLVIFATWSPWKRLIIAIYAALGRAVGPVVLLPFQIALAVAFSLALAFTQVLITKSLELCCGGSGAFDDADDDDDDLLLSERAHFAAAVPLRTPGAGAADSADPASDALDAENPFLDNNPHHVRETSF